MTEFTGTHRETYEVAAPLDTVRALFTDPEAIAKATATAQSVSDAGGGKVAFVLREERQGLTKFTPKYTVQYTTEGDVVSWTTVEGNLSQEGQAKLSASGEGTKVVYEQAITVDVPVPRLAAGALRGFVESKVAEGSKAYVRQLLRQVDPSV